MLVLALLLALGVHAQERIIQTTILESPHSVTPLQDVVPPRVTFLVQRITPRYAITELLLNRSHLLVVDANETLLQPMLNWTQFSPFVVPSSAPDICAKLPKGNCTGFTMSTWSIWNELFGYTDGHSGQRFRLHIPAVVQRTGLKLAAFETTELIVVANGDTTATFACLECARHHALSSMTATDAAILWGLLLVLFVFFGCALWGASVWDAPTKARY